MTQTLTTDELRQIAETDHTQCGDASAMARELLAKREAQPVWIDAEVHEAIQDILQGRMSGAGRYVMLNRNQAPNGFKQRMPIYTAPPAPAVPKEMTLSEAESFIKELTPPTEEEAALFAWNACRAAMLAQPVSQGCELPDNVREALTLALQAMEFMGDTLNNIDAVCTEDVEYVTPAFTAVRGLLAAAPEGGNG